MHILITSPRAPVALEWLKFAQVRGHQVTLCDSLAFPIGIYNTDASIRSKPKYVKVPAPRLDFMGYQSAMLKLIAEADIVIPTCEDIFYLARLPLSADARKKCFMPDTQLLFSLHDKYAFFNEMPMDSAIRFPNTRLISTPADVILDVHKKSVLKPVYSRFGRSVVRGVTADSIKRLDTRPTRRWVQQDFITGEGLCSYAICTHGKVVAHSVYRPRYLLNQSASTYFEPVRDDSLDDFILKFASKHAYHGQVAFDFINDGEALWLLECNPRATSGLHLLRAKLYLDDKGDVQPMIASEISADGIQHGSSQAQRVGASLPLLFGWQALKQGKLSELMADYQCADDVIADLPLYAQWLSLAEMLYRKFRYHKALTNASTFDIEYDGDEN